MRQKGFTLVELIVAMAFFSFMLLLVSVGYLQINKIYQSGVASRRTQQAARAVHDDIAREVRAASSINVVSTDRLCVEGHQTIDYVRNTDNSLDKRSYHGSCASPPAVFTETTLIGKDGNLSGNVVIREFKAEGIVNDLDEIVSAIVTLQVTTGAEDFFTGAPCDPTKTGTQFCATTKLTNTISLRGS